MTLTSDAATLGSVTVGKPADVTITKTAVVHFVYGEIDESTIPLTTWKTNSTLVTGYVPTGTGVAYDNANLVESSVTLDAGFADIEVFAWIEDTTSAAEKAKDANHDANWAAAVAGASNKTQKLDWSYTVGTPETNTLPAQDVIFYFNNAANAVSNAAETNPVQTVSIDASTLTASNKTAATKASLGFLHIRLEGGNRQHSGDYTVTIVGASGNAS